jgi:RHS repeat-associated protein
MTSRVAAQGALASSPNYTTSYDSYDAENRLTELTDSAGGSYRFLYDERGNLKATQYPTTAPTFSWNEFNAAGWLTGTYNRDGDISSVPFLVPEGTPAPDDTTPLADFTYEYEQDGKKTMEKRVAQGFSDETQRFGYDALGRMEAVTLPDGTLRRYAFDRDSNRTQITENGAVTASYAYDPANPDSDGVDQLTSVTEGQQSRTFVHDADGNVTERGTDSLTWDGWGRHTGGSFAGTAVSYKFDPVGFRRERVTAAGTTRYLHGGLFETDSAGAITNADVDGVAGDVAQFAGPPASGTTVSYLYYNGHGDLAATADAAGARTDAFTYDPFGAPKQTPPPNKTVERWTGRWDKKLDTSSSLVEMGARPYDPALGRFLAIDPVDGGSLNNYDFTGQDPIKEYDLDGRCMSFCRLFIDAVRSHVGRTISAERPGTNASS